MVSVPPELVELVAPESLKMVIDGLGRVLWPTLLSLCTGDQELLLPRALFIDLLVQGEAVEEGRHLQHARLNDAAKFLWVYVQPSFPTHPFLDLTAAADLPRRTGVSLRRRQVAEVSPPPVPLSRAFSSSFLSTTRTPALRRPPPP